MTDELKTQWHPAFCAAFRLELKEDLDVLNCINEFNLNSKPLQIDLLIIRKIQDVVTKNNLGKIFRGHNIIEYKSPDDELNVDTFIKVVGYACLYKANEVYVDDIRLDDMTITLVRERYPRKLFQWFSKNGFAIIEKYPGIFYVDKLDCFPVQVVVSKRLSKTEQKWLTLLKSELEQEDLDRAVLQVNELGKKGDQENGDAVLQVVIESNNKKFEKMKGETGMCCQALRDLFAPELAEAKKNAEAEGRAEGKVKGIFELVQKKYLSIEIGAQETGLSIKEFTSKMTEAGFIVPTE